MARVIVYFKNSVFFTKIRQTFLISCGLNSGTLMYRILGFISKGVLIIQKCRFFEIVRIFEIVQIFEIVRKVEIVPILEIVRKS